MNQDQTAVRETGQMPRGEAATTAGRAREATSEAAGTVGEKGREVAGEAATQARNLASEVRDRASSEARSQSHRLAQSVRQWSDDLAGMADAGKQDSPARGLVGQAADQGHRVADYLEERGVGGTIDELQRFARRRPAVFLAGAALAGFLVGRAAKASMGASQEESP